MSVALNAPPYNNQNHRTHHAHKGDKFYEDDPHRLQQRQKQITYGENTPGFQNFKKLLEKDPSLLKGCVPVKPCITQRCSKRSWDGQVRKWRRALHMYDYVDMGDCELESAKVKEALIEQNRNPLFSTPHKPALMSEEDDEFDDIDEDEVETPSGFVPITSPASPESSFTQGSPASPSPERVQYSFERMFELLDSPLVADFIILPESLRYLDKRVDLEDELDEEGNLLPAQSPSLTSPETGGRQLFVGSPGGLVTPARCMPDLTPLRQVSKASPRTPPATDVLDRYHAEVRTETDPREWATSNSLLRASPQTP